tara:strand:- start:29469 stop:29852 length:384 start_codon:yes stop_codon:yes gene_type:complete
MIQGIGTDVIEKTRIENICKKYGDKFIKKILSPSEQKIFKSKVNFKNQVSFLSNNFAAKEAFSKALGTGMKGIAFKEIEVLRLSNGKPQINLSGNVKDKVKQSGAKRFHVSISDTENLSIAFLLIES